MEACDSRNTKSHGLTFHAVLGDGPQRCASSDYSSGTATGKQRAEQGRPRAPVIVTCAGDRELERFARAPGEGARYPAPPRSKVILTAPPAGEKRLREGVKP